ncbi:MAG: 50S ribosomal protein L23 [Candidatus Poribacteria bacterium]|nr:50S ribosomal protein L23 [Candidatus Poribacteria bacterium]
MALSPYEVFRRPLLTEKSTIQRDKYTERKGKEDLVKYTLEVDPRATKVDIKAAMEQLFPESQGNIVQINTLRMKGVIKDADKSRRGRRFRPGKTSLRKKAVVTLGNGATIPQFEGF